MNWLRNLFRSGRYPPRLTPSQFAQWQSWTFAVVECIRCGHLRCVVAHEPPKRSATATNYYCFGCEEALPTGWERVVRSESC